MAAGAYLAAWITGGPYDVGDFPKLIFEVTDRVGENVDPSTVRVKIKRPNDIVEVYEHGVDPELVKDAVGIYHLEWSLTADGPWFVRVEVSGSHEAAEERGLTVRRTAFGE